MSEMANLKADTCRHTLLERKVYRQPLTSRNRKFLASDNILYHDHKVSVFLTTCKHFKHLFSGIHSTSLCLEFEGPIRYSLTDTEKNEELTT